MPSDEPTEGFTARTKDEVIKEDPVIELFGDSAKARVLMTLDVMRTEELTPGEICEHANISRTSWYNVKDDLLDAGLVRQVGRAGNAPMYTMPEDDPRVLWFQWLVDFSTCEGVELVGEPDPRVEMDC